MLSHQVGDRSCVSSEPVLEPPMEATVVLPIEAHVLDTRTGEWCDRCALPSVVEVDVALVGSHSLRIIGRYTGSLCSDCGASDLTR